MPKNPNDDRVARDRGLTPGQVRELRATRGLRESALLRMPDNALQRAVRRLDFLDFPRARAAFRRLQQVDADGRIPDNAVTTALDQLTSLRSRSMRRATVAGVPTGPRVAPRDLIARPLSAQQHLSQQRVGGLEPRGAGWVSLGPGNVGGRTRAIVLHPTEPDRMWVGSAGGGVWYSSNSGASWEPVDDFMANLAVSCLVADPTDPEVLYAGTGEGFSNLDALRGEGIFCTLDGHSWHQLPTSTGPELRWINRLAISADGGTLLAATPAGLFRSSRPDHAAFEQVLAEPMADVRCHPSNPLRAIAGSLRDGRAWISVDGGRCFEPAEPADAWSGRVELAWAAADPETVYASVQMAHGEIWRSRDGGRRFERRASLDADGRPAYYLGDQGWYGNAIWAGDPSDPDFVIVGGIDLWRSRDGGETLEDISTWWEPTSAHADHHTVVAHPFYDGKGNGTVFFGNDGGIFKTDDIATVGDDPEPPRVRGWQELVNTYGVTQFYGGAGNPETGVIVGGAQDNGTVRFDPEAGAESWTSMFGGDGGWCAADPADPRYFYGEYVCLAIHRSSDGGYSSEFICGQFWDGGQWCWKPIPYRIPDAMTGRALFIAPFVLDPNQPERLLAGGLSLWRTDDARAPNTPTRGPSWRAVKPCAGAPISALAIAESDSDQVWVGHSDGQVYKSTDATAESPRWRQVDRRGPQPLAAGRFCTCLAIDPRDPDIVYATFGGYTRGNAWKTLDGGSSWHNVGHLLPQAPVRSLAIHPRREGYVYVGTEVGVYASENGGASWSPTNEGPTNCAVDHLFWMGEILVCATHGRGMFSIDLSQV